eukprot:CAMPEP_0180257730 /NCGR_PEP_ID=MMETSP0987-20121128/42011_1 /TAXON_ID=697907 /ORGANISM="non described non described, Strain CCMP2293" /LENGTH=363 /DNA_ID=CAMNT_0022227127 /DNA_START=58 /DNA_END=1150 /DNA_ORIENTATION=+
MTAPTLEAIKYAKGSLQLLDQLKLPFIFEYLEIRTCEETWDAIKKMQVRGAPAIAIAAALGLAVECSTKQGSFTGSTDEAKAYLVDRLEYLKTSRPTAVNLFNDCDRLIAWVQTQSGDGKGVLGAYMAEAEKMLAKDVSDNMAIGKAGGEAILAVAASKGRKQVKVLTHCNNACHRAVRNGAGGDPVPARDQQPGARLLHRDPPVQPGVPSDGVRAGVREDPVDADHGLMASYLMASKGLDAVVVGADRVVANGDTANKIGTYQLAIVAKHHGAGFYVAVPFTSIDLKTPTGADIHIEQRPGEELTSINGQRIAAEGIGVWNPCFDVTPAALIDGLITEHGIITKAPGTDFFDVAAFVNKHRQ